MHFDLDAKRFVGDGGALDVLEDDEVVLKLAMLMEGECTTLMPYQVAEKFGYSRQRYFQLRKAFAEKGASALLSRKRGPKTNYRRTSEVTRQVIRHRMLDPDASSEVIAQKARQCGFRISNRSVDRIFEEYGLQKRTLQISS